MRKEIRQFSKRAAERGWAVTHTRGGHLRFRHPNGSIVFTGTTPSDNRAIANAEAMLRRAERTDIDTGMQHD